MILNMLGTEVLISSVRVFLPLTERHSPPETSTNLLRSLSELELDHVSKR